MNNKFKETCPNLNYRVFDLLHDLMGENRKQKLILDEISKSLMNETAANHQVLYDMRKNLENLQRLWDTLEATYIFFSKKL